MHLSKQLILPCGVTLDNRIAKSAMSENFSPRHHGPTEYLIQAYRRWTQGGAGLVITGNIMIDHKAIAEPGNVLIENKQHLDMLRRWAMSVQGTPAQLWAQINHPGRQAIGFINRKVVAPSAIKTQIKGMSAMFKKPKALTEDEILAIIQRFGETAVILQEAGFGGVQIHGAHGYLVSQFLSPLTNQRTDKWGGPLEHRARFVIEVYRSIRKRVGEQYPIGIKINSADFQRGGFTEEESMEVVRMLSAEGIDLIEVSGGTYERPAMTGAMKKSTMEREAYFLNYVQKVRNTITTPLMLTGGFRTVAVMEAALSRGELDVVGMARPFCLYPDLPQKILNGHLDHIHIPNPQTGLKMIDKSGFIDIKWHEVQIHHIGKGLDPDPQLSAWAAVRHNLTITGRKMLAGKLS